MDTSSHTLSTLFEQLGLPSSNAEIERFIETHRLFTQEVAIDQASFWSDAQSDFLKEALYSDSDWAEVVDELSSRLRSTH